MAHELLTFTAFFSLILGCWAKCDSVESCDSTYMIVMPQQIRPGREFDISVHILQSESPVTVSVTMVTKAGDGSTTQADFTAGQAGLLTFPTPTTFDTSSIMMRFIGSGGLTFNKTQSVRVARKTMSLMVQTDKAMYKPGDLVQFRVVGMHLDLKPYTSTMTVEMKDPKNNKVKQWLDQSSEYGVVTLEFQLTEQTNLGMWQIIVETQQGSSTMKTIEVAEYVLPKFEVTIDAPNFVTLKTNQLVFTVNAKYTYGQDVKGSCKVKMHVPYESSGITLEKELVDGKAEFTLSREEFAQIAPRCTYNCKEDETIEDKLERFYHGQQINISASVMETLTGIELHGTKMMAVYEKKYKVEWVSSTPTIYKPGLTWEGYFEVKQADGSPVDAANLVPPNDRVQVLFRLSSSNAFTGPTSEVENITIPSDGFIRLIKVIPSTVNSVTVTVKHEGSRFDASRSLQPYKSSQGLDGVQIAIVDQSLPLQVGSVTFSVKFSRTVGQFYFQLYAKSELIFQDLVTTSADATSADGQTTMTYVLNLTEELAQLASPNVKVLVWYITSEGEVITDSVELTVDALFANQVDVTFNKDQSVLPGTDVKLSVTAYPGSQVHVLAVDQSVLLLRDGNDITQEMVKGEVASYDTGHSYYYGGFGVMNERGRRRRKRSVMPWWPIFIGGSDATDVFRNAGVLVITDSYLYDYQDDNYWYRYDDEVAEMAPAAEAGDAENGGEQEKTSADAGAGDDVREDFPETWIWLSELTGTDGTAEFSVEAPDTITSWMASAFAMSPSVGLGVASTMAKLTVFKPMFISINMPYSMIRNEEVSLQIIVFNYEANNLTVDLVIARSEFFQIRKSINDRSTSTQIEQQLVVPSNDGVSFKVLIRPVQLGSIPIEISATTSSSRDALRQMLLVEPEGDQRELTQSALIRLEAADDTFSKVFPVEYPDEGVVPGSERVEFTVMGNPMGAILENLDHLIRMPYGCGEQNILSFSPNVYALMYMEATNQDDPKIRDKALRNMEAGYQRELIYHREDKSFSAFGERDDAGSTWLTAFVIRSFNQARQYLLGTLDQDVLDDSMEFILRQQTSDGHFREPGRVIHTDMQGGASGGLAMTAFTAVALLENMQGREEKSDDLAQRLQRATSTTIELLTRELEGVKTDKYTLTLVTYALTIAESSSAAQALQYLNDVVTEEDGMKHWGKADEVSTCTRFCYSRVSSNTLEMTSYALLVYIEGNKILEGLPIVKYIVSKRSSLGGYGSTQNTLIALLALTKYTIAMGPGDGQNVLVSISQNSGEVKNFDPVTEQNSLIVQKKIVDHDPGEIALTATGSGIAVAQVTVFYHEVLPTSKDVEVRVVSTFTDDKEVETTACARWVSSDDSGMVLMDLVQLTGYSASTEGLVERYSKDGLKRVEQKEGVLSLYFDELNKTDKCVQIKSVGTADVLDMQQRAVRVSSYYNPEMNGVAFYLPQELSLTTTDPGENKDPSNATKLSAALVIMMTNVFMYFLL